MQICLLKVKNFDIIVLIEISAKKSIAESARDLASPRSGIDSKLYTIVTLDESLDLAKTHFPQL